MIGLPHVLATGLLAVGLSSCSLLDLFLGAPPFDPNASFPPFPLESAAATYSTGQATVKLNGQTLVLDHLVPGAAADGEYGTHVVWTDGAGWYVSYSSVPDSGVLGTPSLLTFDRIVDHAHWVIVDPFRCVTTTTKADPTQLVGTSLCRGLTWSDWFGSQQLSGLPQPIPSQPPFDADVTFEAH